MELYTAQIWVTVGKHKYLSQSLVGKYDEAFDNLWADEATKPREYSEFEEEEAAVKFAAIRGRQTGEKYRAERPKLEKEKRSKKKRKAKEERPLK